jgi:hypothetical protein
LWHVLTGIYSWMELVYNPRNNVEQYISKALRFIHPYLAFVTYRFHVEKAREAGTLFVLFNLILYRY